MEFALFILLNFMLFVRPGEIIPDLAEVPFYNILILATFVMCTPQVLDCLRPERLSSDPITACVIGLIPAVFISHLAHFDFYSAREAVESYGKTAIYYLALIAVINSTRRLQSFLLWLSLFATVTLTLAVLHFFEIIHLPALKIVQDSLIDPETGEAYLVPRLCGSGLFGDPNDLSMITVAGMIICIFAMSDKTMGLLRFLWLAPFALFFFALTLTQSRGGLLAFSAAVGALLYSRFGLRKTMIAALAIAPVVGALIGGRQSDMSGETGDARMELWSEGMVLLKSYPLFGVGYCNYAEECGQVAHNSYVHCFVELGILGGAAFFGIVWFAAISLKNISRQLKSSLRGINPTFQRLHPYVTAILVGYAVSMFTLSRSYVVPTYVIFGIVGTYCRIGGRLGIQSQIRINARSIVRLLLGSVAFLAFIHVFIKLKLR